MQSWVETIRFDFTLRMRGASFLLLAGEYVVSLARWMHRVCAEVAGCYAKSDYHPVRLGLALTHRGHVGRPSPMVASMDMVCGTVRVHRGRCPPC
jgi:hypothetical protein